MYEYALYLHDATDREGGGGERTGSGRRYHSAPACPCPPTRCESSGRGAACAADERWRARCT